MQRVTPVGRLAIGEIICGDGEKETMGSLNAARGNSQIEVHRFSWSVEDEVGSGDPAAVRHNKGAAGLSHERPAASGSARPRGRSMVSTIVQARFSHDGVS